LHRHAFHFFVRAKTPQHIEHKKMSVVGFDIGNESCLIAVARRRVIDVLQNQSGHRKTPTMVGFQGKQRLMGDDAAAQYMTNFKNTIRCIKRILGRKFDEPELKEEELYLPNRLVKLPNGKVGVTVSYNDEDQTFTAEQLAGAMFQKLKQITEARLEGQKVSDVVISCPPYWHDAERRALLDAANIAGLNVLRIINETSAIALTYGLLRNLPEKDPIKVLFVDVGNASTNVAVVSFVSGKLNVLGTASDRNLGARNFDKLLVNHFAAYIKTKYKLDVMSETKARLKLLKECERIKTVLSANATVPFNVEFIMNDTDVSGSITRAEFEEMSGPLLKRLLAPVQQVLELTGTKKEELFAVEVVGGGTRIPAVQKALKDFFGKELSRTLDGDDSVSRGCALQCAMLSPNVVVRQFEVHDITPFMVDIGWAAGNTLDAAEEDHALLFKLRDPIPSVKMISFKHRPDFQLRARYLHPETLPMGVDPLIGQILIKDIPPVGPNDPPGKIKVKVKLDVNCLISVSSAQMLQDFPVVEDPKDVKMQDAKDAAGQAAATGAPPASPAGPDSKPQTPQPEQSQQTPPAQPSEQAGASPMEHEEEEEKAGQKMEVDKEKAATTTKVRTVRKNLTVEAHFTNGLSQGELQTYADKEYAMNAQDCNIAETDERRNELESYVLEMRNAIGGELGQFGSEAEQKTFSAALETMEQWLYNEGIDAQKSEYVNRLKQLKEIGDAFTRRKYESENRNAFAEGLRSSIQKFVQFASSTDEKYAHIPAADREKVLQDCATAEQWLSQGLATQAQTPLSQNPVITCAEMQSKRDALEHGLHPIMTRPKPPPPAPKKEEPAPQPQPQPQSQPQPQPTGDATAQPPPASTTGSNSGSADSKGASSSTDKGMDLD
jgi:heat shock protein 4